MLKLLDGYQIMLNLILLWTFDHIKMLKECEIIYKRIHNQENPARQFQL